jgi:hypothetical protein
VAAACLPVALCRGTWLAALLLGYASHLLADCLTKTGAPLLHPCLHACVLPGPERFRFRSRSVAERVFLVVVLLLLVPAFNLSRAGGVWHALRHWAATPAMAYREYRDATSETVLEFQGQWQDTRQPVAGEALILEATPNPARFVVLFQEQVRVYGEQGDLLPQRSRIRITGRPLQVDTLRVQRTPYAALLGHLPKGVLVTGVLASPVPYTPGLRGELPRSHHASVRCDEQTLALAFAPHALLAQLHPSRKVDPEQLAQLHRQVQQQELDFLGLQLQRPPVHYLMLQAAAARLRARQEELASLQDTTVRYTGVLYLRHVAPANATTAPGVAP